MTRVLHQSVLVLLVLGIAIGGVQAGETAGTATHPEIVAVYPNPIPADDPGEYVTIQVPPGTTLDSYSIDDGENRVSLANRSVSGRVRLSVSPAAVRNQTYGDDGLPVVELEEPLSLSNAGERLVLRHRDTVVDSLTYGAVSEGEVWRNGSAEPRGRSSFGATQSGPGTLDAFVVPDGAGVPIDALESASDRILLAGYTFTSWRAAAELAAASARGVDVRVLVEGGPVGGVSRRAATVLRWLSETGVTVRVLDGPASRYRFHHAKYAVIDDSALVTSENWDPGGLGGHGTRGWGVLVQNAALTSNLSEVFRADWRWTSALSWERYETRTTFYPSSPATTTYATRFPPAVHRFERVTLLSAPDNVAAELLTMVRRADDSIRVVQPRIGNQTPLRQALISAARRGVTVRILVSGSWYSEAKNEALARHLRKVARLEDLPIAIKLASPRSRYNHLHAKGLIIDGDTVVVGSVNWNTVSTTQNREVALAIRSESLARYFTRIFLADWRGAAWRLSVTVGAIVTGVAALTIVLVCRAVRFAGRPGDRHRVRQRPSSPPEDREPPPGSQRRT